MFLTSLYKYITLQSVIWLVVIFPLAGAILNGFIALATIRLEKTKTGPLVAFIALITSFLSLVSLGIVFFTLTGFEASTPAAITGPLFTWLITWAINISVGLSVDELSLTIGSLVCVISFLINLYSVIWFARDKKAAAFYALSSLIAFFTLLAIFADNLALLFIGFEGAGLGVYAMCGHLFRQGEDVFDVTKAFFFDKLGSLSMLIAIGLIYGVMMAAGVDPRSDLFDLTTLSQYAAYFVPVATMLAILIFIAVATKTAMLPFSIGLTSLSNVPVSVSAIVQASSIMAIGVYLIARLNFIFALAPNVLAVIAIIGAVTAIYAAIVGVVATDIRKVLTYSTISQMGFVFIAIGVGAFPVSIFHLLTHSAAKALFFMCAGNVIMELGGETDILKMGGLKKKMPVTAWCFIIAAASLAGLVPLSGFFSQEAIMWQVYERGHGILWATAFLCQGLTAFYIFRAAGRIFFGNSLVPPELLKRVVEAPASLVVPILILTSIVLLGGFAGVPNILYGSDRLGAWLSHLVTREVGHAPSIGSGTEIVLMVVSVLWCAHFSIVGFIIFAQRRDLPLKMARKFSFIHNFLDKQCYLDHLARIIVWPFAWFVSNVLIGFIEHTIVDGIIFGGISRVTDFTATLTSVEDDKLARRRFLYLLAGAAILIIVLAL